jgi:hypothetical protein
MVQDLDCIFISFCSLENIAGQRIVIRQTSFKNPFNKGRQTDTVL